MDSFRLKLCISRRNLQTDDSEYNEIVQMRSYFTCSVFVILSTAILVIILCVCSTESRDQDQSYMTPTTCPSGTVPCATRNVCINITKRCDGVNDCEDKSDEHCDKHQDSYYDDLLPKRPDHDRHIENRTCVVPPAELPLKCECRNGTNVYCANQQLRRVPKPLPWQLTKLDLGGNNITSISLQDFKNLTNLEELMFERSSLRSIADQTFHNCNKTHTVRLSGNRLRRFSSGIFSRRNRVTTLVLNDNNITFLHKDDLKHFWHLERLSMDHNYLTTLDGRTFSWTPNLNTLSLRNNGLTEISGTFFNHTSALKSLYLEHNRIRYIERGSFSKMSKLEQLSLSDNDLGMVGNHMFDGLKHLRMLKLSGNKIETIEVGVFSPLQSLESLDLEENPFRRLSRETFSSMSQLKYAYFDKFYMCAYVKTKLMCFPLGDGISSQKNLLENIVLRVCVWLVAVLACAGNIVVLLGRFILKEDNQTHSFFIKNLSLADMLMGIYLLIIGARDKMYRGKYMFQDEAWRNSWECDLSGILSTVSSEMSVMTLTLITLDRYMSIMYPLSFRKRGLKMAYLAVGTLWMTAILLAVIPVLKLDYFGKAFYRDNAVCIPLHLHDPYVKGWEYSAVLILGVNSVSFGFISYAYSAMFISIHKTDIPLRTTRESRDRCLVKRFFFIVITDFLCWVPIIVIKTLALSGVNISDDLYAWVIVFVLPVNSALNPLLYTLTTKLFKQKLFSKFSNVAWKPSLNKDLSHSMSSVRNLNRAVYRAHALSDVELKCLRQYQKLDGSADAVMNNTLLQNPVPDPLRGIKQEVTVQISQGGESTHITSLVSSPT